MYKKDLALNDQQRLIYHKTKLNQIKQIISTQLYGHIVWTQLFIHDFMFLSNYFYLTEHWLSG